MLHCPQLVGKLFDHSLQKLKNERAQARKVLIILGRYQLPHSFHSFAFWKQTNKQKKRRSDLFTCQPFRLLRRQQVGLLFKLFLSASQHRSLTDVLCPPTERVEGPLKTCRTQSSVVGLHSVLILHQQSATLLVTQGFQMLPGPGIPGNYTYKDILLQHYGTCRENSTLMTQSETN